MLIRDVLPTVEFMIHDVLPTVEMLINGSLRNAACDSKRFLRHGDQWQLGLSDCGGID